MAGLTDKAMNRLDSKNKFNRGVELEEDYGLNLYATFYRQYDPQIGRFDGVDVLSERAAGMSAYQFGNNNPVSLNDPLGAWVSLATESNARYNAWGSSRDRMDEYQNENGAWGDYDPITDFDNQNSNGGFGNGPYARHYQSIFNETANGTNTTHTDQIPTDIFADPDRSYIYATADNSGRYQTGIYHGDIDEDKYMNETFFLTTYEPLDWSGIGNATLGLAGGGAEWIVGGGADLLSGGTATPLTISLFVDGGVRIGANASKLLGYFSGHKAAADAIPSNIGAAVGKAIDMASGHSFYNYGYGQAIGGGLNDVATFVFTGGSGDPLSLLMNNPTPKYMFLYGVALPGYTAGLYDDFAPLNK